MSVRRYCRVSARGEWRSYHEEADHVVVTLERPYDDLPDQVRSAVDALEAQGFCMEFDDARVVVTVELQREGEEAPAATPPPAADREPESSPPAPPPAPPQPRPKGAPSEATLDKVRGAIVGLDLADDQDLGTGAVVKAAALHANTVRPALRYLVTLGELTHNGKGGKHSRFRVTDRLVDPAQRADEAEEEPEPAPAPRPAAPPPISRRTRKAIVRENGHGPAAAAVAAGASTRPLAFRVLDCLKANGPLSVPGVCALLGGGVKPAEVAQEIQRLVRNGDAHKTKAGSYGHGPAISGGVY